MKDISQSLMPLFDFDSVVDINLSILHLINDMYPSSKYFIDASDEYFNKCLLTTLPKKNLVTHILTSKYVDRVNEDSFYQDFIEDPDIEKYYVTFPMAKMIDVSIESGLNVVTVLCSNKRQEEWIKKRFKPIKTVILPEGKKIELKNRYDGYYTSDISNLNKKILPCADIQFRILRFDYNLEPKGGIDLLKLDMIKNFVGRNSFALIDPYDDIILPDREEE